MIIFIFLFKAIYSTLLKEEDKFCMLNSSDGQLETKVKYDYSNELKTIYGINYDNAFCPNIPKALRDYDFKNGHDKLIVYHFELDPDDEVKKFLHDLKRKIEKHDFIQSETKTMDENGFYASKTLIMVCSTHQDLEEAITKLPPASRTITIVTSCWLVEHDVYIFEKLIEEKKNLILLLNYDQMLGVYSLVPRYNFFFRAFSIRSFISTQIPSKEIVNGRCSKIKIFFKMRTFKMSKWTPAWILQDTNILKSQMEIDI